MSSDSDEQAYAISVQERQQMDQKMAKIANQVVQQVRDNQEGK